MTHRSVQFSQRLAAALFVASAAVTVFGKPAFMDRYNVDPESRPDLRNKCTVCHVGRGGGERNDFGEAFADSGFRITPKLRKQFPDMFVSPQNGSGNSGQRP